MTELGQRLKEARELRGMTLDEIQEITKIQKRYLQAIEDGKYEVLPGEFYKRAFVKQYAEAVGIQPDELLNSKEKEDVVKEESKKQEVPVRTKKEKEVNMNTSSLSSMLDYLPRILMGVIVVGGLVAIWLFFQGNNDQPEAEDTPQEQVDSNVKSDEPVESPLNSENQDTTESEEDVEEEGIPEETQEEAQVFTVTETDGNRSTVSMTGNDTFVLTLTGKDDESYVRVQNEEGNVFYDGMIEPGQSETIDLTAENTVEINVGFSLGLDLKVNDELLEYPLEPSDNIHQYVTIERTIPTEE